VCVTVLNVRSNSQPLHHTKYFLSLLVIATDTPVAAAAPIAGPEPVVEEEKVEKAVAEPDVEAPVAEAPTPATAVEKDYSSMDEGERAFNILVDLGMVDLTPDPDSPDYDSSKDDEIAG